MTDRQRLTTEQLQNICDRCPFHQWMALRVDNVDPEGITLGVEWKEEFVSSPEKRSIHGGILATLIDTAGAYAVSAVVGTGLPTVDIRVDYHRMAKPGGRLTVHARVVHMGGTLATAEARITDSEGTLVASGRGTYFVATALKQGKAT